MTASTATPPPPNLWRDRDFRTFWAGETVSHIGDRISELALPLLAVTVLHATPAEVGLLTAAVWAPNLLSLFVGSWVDHQQRKRRLMIAADLLRAAVLASIPAAYLLDMVTLPQLFAVALIAGAGQVLFGTAYASFFVALVPRAAFLDANSLLSATRSASFVAGPALGGGLISLVTAPVAILVDAASFVMSAVLIGRVRVRELEPDRESASVARRAVAGLRYVLSHPYLRWSLACATTVNLFSFMAAALVILFASRELGLGAGVIGLAFGIGATGGLVGAVAAPRLARWFGVGPVICFGAVMFPLPIALIAAAHGPRLADVALLGAAEFLSGFGVMCFDVNLNSLQASVITNEVRSRVAGAFSTINYGIRPLGAVLGGVLGTYLGLRPTLVVAAIGGALSVLWLLPSPIARVRDLADVAPS